MSIGRRKSHISILNVTIVQYLTLLLCSLFYINSIDLTNGTEDIRTGLIIYFSFVPISCVIKYCLYFHHFERIQTPDSRQV